MSKAKAVRDLVTNRKAKHEYTLTDRFEAGISLLGTEVKSLRSDGTANLRDAFVELRPKGAYILGFYIAPYSHARADAHDPRRPRQLLLHKHELSKLSKLIKQRGMTIIPTRVYFSGSKVKVEIAAAKGKKQYDKRQAIKKRDIDKQLRRIK